MEVCLPVHCGGRSEAKEAQLGLATHPHTSYSVSWIQPGVPTEAAVSQACAGHSGHVWALWAFSGRSQHCAHPPEDRSWGETCLAAILDRKNLKCLERFTKFWDKKKNNNFLPTFVTLKQMICRGSHRCSQRCHLACEIVLHLLRINHGQCVPLCDGVTH